MKRYCNIFLCHTDIKLFFPDIFFYISLSLFFAVLLLQLWSASLLLLIKWNTFISNHSLYLSNYLTRFLFHSWSFVRCNLSISLCDSLWGNRKQRFFYLFCVMYIWIFLGIFVHYKLIYTSILTGKCSGLEKRHVVIFWTFLYSNILNLNSVVFFLLGSNYPYCFLWIENFNYDKIFVDLLSIGRTTFL